MIPRKLKPEHGMLAGAARTWRATGTIHRRLREELIAATRELIGSWYAADLMPPLRSSRYRRMSAAFRALECLVGRPGPRTARVVPTVAMLLRLNFLESDARSDLIDGGSLARVHVFADRLPRMHRQGWVGRDRRQRRLTPGSYGKRDHAGPTTLDRIWCGP